MINCNNCKQIKEYKEKIQILLQKIEGLEDFKQVYYGGDFSARMRRHT